MVKFKKGQFVIYNGHLVKIKSYIRSDYVHGEDEIGNTVNFIEDFGELATIDKIIDWEPKGDIKPSLYAKVESWIEQALIVAYNT